MFKSKDGKQWFDPNKNEFVCSVCGGHTNIKLPLDLDQFDKEVKSFIKAHKNCKGENHG